MSSAEMHEAILTRSASFDLANGWRLARRRLMGADRVEIEGPADGDLAALKRMGCATEIVSWRTRVFVPEYIDLRPHPRTLAARGCEPGVNPHSPARYPARGRANPWFRALRALPVICAFAPPTAANCTTCHRKDIAMPSSHTLPDDPVYAFCPSYDLDNVPQQIRIVFDNMPGYVPTALFALSLDDALRICNRLNARLGLDYDAWSAIAGRAMSAAHDETTH